MRHGAGPFSSSHEIKAEAVNDLPAEIATVSLTDNTRGQRLGCYFCNDVVAPVDASVTEAARLGFHTHPPTHPMHMYIFSLFITEETF